MRRREIYGSPPAPPPEARFQVGGASRRRLHPDRTDFLKIARYVVLKNQKTISRQKLYGFELNCILEYVQSVRVIVETMKNLKLRYFRYFSGKIWYFQKLSGGGDGGASSPPFCSPPPPPPGPPKTCALRRRLPPPPPPPHPWCQYIAEVQGRENELGLF